MLAQPQAREPKSGEHISDAGHQPQISLSTQASQSVSVSESRQLHCSEVSARDPRVVGPQTEPSMMAMHDPTLLSGSTHQWQDPGLFRTQLMQLTLKAQLGAAPYEGETAKKNSAQNSARELRQDFILFST